MGGKASNKAANQARWDEDQRQQRVRDGTTRVGDIFGKNFGDDFYKKRQQSYVDFATPQLEDQRADAQKQLTYNLARSGTLDSSIRGDKLGELQKLYDLNKQDIADKALSSATDARNSVEGARTDLIQTLSATGDAEAAANSALSRSTALTQPAAYSPLTQVFAGFTNTLGQQAAQEKAESLSGGAYEAKYNTGLFGTPTGSVKVKR